MLIDVVGAGALGLMYGGALALSGEQVRFWTRTGDQAQQLLVNGITLNQPDEKKYSVEPARYEAAAISALPDIWAEHPGDVIMLMTKQGGLHEIIEILNKVKNLNTAVYCFQNGTGHIPRITKALPDARIYAAVTTEGAKRNEKHEVSRAGRGETVIGSLKSESELENTEVNSFVRALLKAGFNTKSSNEIDRLIYRKLVINAVINPLTAIWRVTNGELLASEERVQTMRQLYNEAVAVYDAHDIPYDADLWEQVLGVCKSTSSNWSSMCMDVLHERPTEISAINGSIVTMAEEAGVCAEGHQLICKLIEGMPLGKE
ncbi:2-dehydropantoate 2-reductase [Neobacillus mesonae]|nr:2-dehydropantoate 2-reductase [Neobacillus mesonae]